VSAAAPTDPADRDPALDAVRGLALLGVLLMNVHSGFRVPLPVHILDPDPGPGWADRAVAAVLSTAVEFKAFALFSLLFGVGLAAQAGRRADPGRFLGRRLLILLAVGLAHQWLVWNGDILTLYAACGLLLVPFLRLPAGELAVAGAGAVALAYILPWEAVWPGEGVVAELAAEGRRVYADGSPAEMLAYHARETRELILVLLLSSVPRTWGLMAVGAAAWKAGVLSDPGRHRRLLRAVAVVWGVVGVAATVLRPETGWAVVPLAFAYGAGLLLLFRRPAVARLAAPIAAVGRTALTNYLAQSVILSVLFYGYGLGLSGRVGTAAAAGVGLAVYAAQAAASVAWLRRFRFGPAEWAWRSLAYGRRQPLRR
jgi:uncharacterized protein